MHNNRLKINYDPFNCNNGIPFEPNTHWVPRNKAWELNDFSINSDFIPDSIPSHLKEALKNNICIVCGEKNCPYLKNKSYQELMKAINSGDKHAAHKAYVQRFQHYEKMQKGLIETSLKKARAARERQGPCGSSGPFQSRALIAIPGKWSKWDNLIASQANQQNTHAYTVNFNISSNLESSFDVQIRYPVSNGIKTINTIGPGSYFIEASSAGYSSIRVKSHSIPITIRIDYPAETNN